MLTAWGGWGLGGAGVGALLIAGGVWFVRRSFVAITVRGDSMAPTLLPGGRVLIRRGVSGLRPGGIAVIASPDPDPARGWRERPPLSRDLGEVSWFIKRVVAVEGDAMPKGVAGEAERVPPGHFVAIGDHPLSQDSKQYGPCPVDQVLGTMVRRL